MVGIFDIYIALGHGIGITEQMHNKKDLRKGEMKLIRLNSSIREL